MERQLGPSELSVISWVSAIEGCPLSEVPLYSFIIWATYYFFYSGHNFLKPSLLPRLSQPRSNSHLCSRVIATSLPGEANISTAVRARILDWCKSCYETEAFRRIIQLQLRQDTLSSLTNGYQASVWGETSVWGEALETRLNAWFTHGSWGRGWGDLELDRRYEQMLFPIFQFACFSRVTPDFATFTR